MVGLNVYKEAFFDRTTNRAFCGASTSSLTKKRDLCPLVLQFLERNLLRRLLKVSTGVLVGKIFARES